MEDLPPRRRRRRSQSDRPRRSPQSEERPKRRRRRRQQSGFEWTYNRSLGLFGIVFGFLIISTSFCGGAGGGGAYGAGLCCGGIFGLLFFISGIYYIIRG